MSINFEKALGSAERALLFRSQRAEVLSNNIANVDTPNFKARDLDFSCSGLMIPDIHLGENARQNEVSDDQTTPYLFP